ncbi:efflux transporter outer membrane subunit [uncultured Desulfosarcina sp.]|uniref:efflux transporter outer membrane subunit n=1 Tax=uncultured Desulfosarcina sp. TaxID=218289 RepID=UPI0029C99829|nr:efflux transporter outer membrane subunit [uncultured Desulfosarcina sp.]
MINSKNRHSNRWPGGIAVVSVILMMTGCAAVGPDYEAPVPELTDAWQTPLQDGLRAESVDPDQLARWWETLDDPLLAGLIEKTLIANPDLKQAIARVRQSRASRAMTAADRFPTLDVGGSVTTNRISKDSSSTESGIERDWYEAGFDAGWEVDVFGGVRRSVEAADADLQAVQAELDDVRVSLAAEVARNYIEARTYQYRLDVAMANIKAQEETVDLIESRFEAGLSNELDTQQARYNLEDTRSQLPGLRSGLEAAKNRLAVLTGQAPGSLREQLEERLPIPVPPLTVAVGVPANTLRRRPDIRSAERQLAAQSARIGVATADLYPKFQLLGTIGLESINSGDFFDKSSRFWNLGPSVSWRIFDAGAIRRNIEVQNAIADRYLAAYEGAVLAALEEVENALNVYAEEQVRRSHLKQAVVAAQRAVDLAQDRYAAGLVDFSNVLDAQRSLLSFQDGLAQSEGTVTTNLISLYKALGGGWERQR